MFVELRILFMNFQHFGLTFDHLIPYPFGSGIEEQIPVLQGRIQVPVPALRLFQIN